MKFLQQEHSYWRLYVQLEQKNLVIGTAIGYTIPQLKNFVLSFRQYNQKDDVIILSDNQSLDQFQEFFQVFNVKSRLFETLGYIRNYVPNGIAFNTRFIKNYEILYDNNHYRHVLMSDVGDVVFQSDPFCNLPDEFLYFFNEDSQVSIRSNEFNAWWVHAAYGNEGLDQIGDKAIICCGTIMGSRQLIMDYVRLMIQEMQRLRLANPSNDVIIDQAITNYIAYTYPQSVLPRTICKNGEIIGTIGVSLTQGDRAHDTISFDLGKVYVNGLQPAVLHQYNRNKFLLDHFNNTLQTHLVLQ